MLQIILHSGFFWPSVAHFRVARSHNTLYRLVLFCCQHVSYSVNRKFGSKFSMNLLNMGKDTLTVCIAGWKD